MNALALKDKSKTSYSKRTPFIPRVMIKSVQSVIPANNVPFIQTKCACGGSCPVCIGSHMLQTKLAIGQPNDKYEQEADRVADQVIRSSDPLIQRQIEQEENEEAFQTKPIADQITPLVQRQIEPEDEEEQEDLIQSKTGIGQPSQINQNTAFKIQGLKGRGKPLDSATRIFMEPHFGSDFSQVRIHTDDHANDLARSINARAFTIGCNVVFGPGEYAPGLNEGKKLLAHELTHVVQQNSKQDMGARNISPQVTPRVQRAVRFLSCQNPTGRVREIVGDNPMDTLQAADTRAIQLLDNTIGELEYTQAQIRRGEPPLWPTISDAVGMGLQNRFGLNPHDREIWTTTRRQTRGGNPTITLLIFRLRHTREALASGSIRYGCLERPPCPPMSTPGTVVLGPFAFTDSGEYRVYLCERFWNHPEFGTDERSLTLIHEAFHVYFVGIDSGRNMWNANCIDYFVADSNGVTIPEDLEGCCEPGVSCEY